GARRTLDLLDLHQVTDRDLVLLSAGLDDRVRCHRSAALLPIVLGTRSHGCLSECTGIHHTTGLVIIAASVSGGSRYRDPATEQHMLSPGSECQGYPMPVPATKPVPSRLRASGRY